MFDCYYDDVGIKMMIIVELDVEWQVVLRFFDCFEYGLGDDVYVSILEVFMDCQVDIFIKVVQDCIVVINEVCFDVQVGKDMGEFDCDIAVACDDEVFGQAFEMENFV